MATDDDVKVDIMKAVSDWIDRALRGESDTLTIGVVEHRGTEVVFNMVEGDYADDELEPSEEPSN